MVTPFQYNYITAVLLGDYRASIGVSLTGFSLLNAGHDSSLFMKLLFLFRINDRISMYRIYSFLRFNSVSIIGR